MGTGALLGVARVDSGRACHSWSSLVYLIVEEALGGAPVPNELQDENVCARLSESKQTVMSAVLGSVGDPAGLLDPDVESILEEKNQLISRQYAEIERLQRELSEVIGERDALLCEVSKFKFEREMTDLTRLLDDRYVPFKFVLFNWSVFVFFDLFDSQNAIYAVETRKTLI